jgi:hypothetical protein
MSRHELPSWYEPDDVSESMQNVADNSDVYLEEVVDIFQYHEFDAPRDRIRELVETARDRISDLGSDSEAQTEVTDEPRSLEPRFVDVTDVGYLDAQDFALVLGVVLSRYEGSFTIPEVEGDVAVDLLWNRQHTTVALRTISRPPEMPVEEADVQSVVRGDTDPGTGRSLSRLGIVSNAGFTNDARDLATANDIELFGEDHLERWLADTMLTHETLGALLESEDSDTSEFEDVLADLQTIPETVRERDPLNDVTSTEWSTTDDGSPTVSGVKQRMPVAEDPPSPGTHGELYADPSEDGDFGAFDRFVNELQEDAE